MEIRDDALDVTQVHRYRQATPTLATSGQPSAEQLASIAAAGYEVVINLALHDDPRYSLPDEAGVVRGLGLDYVHIPVRFDAPTAGDLRRFFQAMEAHAHRRIWLHCAANLRVGVFLGLYRCLHDGWPREQAFAPLHELWQPDPVWSEFIHEQLESGTRLHPSGPPAASNPEERDPR
jgi:protein tyrosine phosphatase (PTP) superfamily phosphohydrolase (DUF442 family)